MAPRKANSEQTRLRRWQRGELAPGRMVRGGAGHNARPTGWNVKTVVLLWTLCIVSSGSTGCVTGRPNLAHPGNLQTQRFNAIAHDPYADPDLGPEVVGGRPREFQKNLAEPVRNRWLMDSWWARTATGR